MNKFRQPEKLEIPFLQKIDIFGVGVNIHFNKREKYQTKLGGLFSILVYVLMFIYSLNLLNMILSRTDPIVIFEQNSVTQPKRFDLDPKKFSIAFALLNQNLEPFIDETLYGLSGEIYYRNKIWNNTTQQYHEDVGTQQFQMVPCTDQNFQEPESRSYFLSLNYTNMYCIKDSSLLFIEGQFDADRFTMIKINVTECSDKQDKPITCQDQQERKKQLQNTKLQIYYVNRIISIRDYDNPFHPVGQTQFWRSNYNMVQQINLMFINTYISDDINLVYGESHIKQRELVFSQDRLLQGSRGKGSNQNIYEIEIYMDKNKENVYRRVYQKLPQAISQIGGIFNVFFAVGCLFSHPYAKMQLEKKLINQIFQIKNENEEKDNKKKSKSKQVYSSNKRSFKSENQQKMDPNHKKSANKDYPTTKTINLTENQERNSNSKQEDQVALKINLHQEGSQNTFGNEGKQQQKQKQESQMNRKYYKTSKSNLEDDQISSKKMIQNIDENKRYQQSVKGLRNINKIYDLDFFTNLFSQAKLKTKDYINSFLDYFSCQKTSRMYFLENSINQINQHTDICQIINKSIELENLKSLLLDDYQTTLFKCIPKPAIIQDKVNSSQNKFDDFFGQVHNLYDFIQKQKNMNETRFQINLMKFMSEAKFALKKMKNNKNKTNLKLIQMLDKELINTLNEDLYLESELFKNKFQKQNNYDVSQSNLQQNESKSQQIQNQELSQLQTLSLPITQSQYFIQKSNDQINLSFNNEENHTIQPIKNIDHVNIIPHQLNIINFK